MFDVFLPMLTDIFPTVNKQAEYIASQLGGFSKKLTNKIKS